MTLAELGQRTGLPKQTLHRVCWKLASLGMLSHSERGFEVGAKLFELGSMRPNVRELREVSMPWLHELAARTSSMTNLAIRSEGGALVVEEVYGQSASRVPSVSGTVLPLHSTAVGKAVLCGLDESQFEEYLSHGPWRPRTRNTIVHPAVLRRHICEARELGVVVSREEWSPGIFAAAAPVFRRGSLVAAIAVAGGPKEPDMNTLTRYVREVSIRLSGVLTSPRLGQAI